MTDTAPPAPPSLESMAAEIFASSTLTTEEKQLWLLLLRAFDRLEAQLAEYRASLTAFEQGAEERLRAVLRAEPRPRLKLVPVAGDPPK